MKVLNQVEVRRSTIEESVIDMKTTNTINLAGGTLTLAMSIAVASVAQHAWADDMTQSVPAEEVQDANGADVVALQAIFMDVQGKVRWRTSESSPWTEAKVNDLLDAGAEIRTGLKSRSTLRVGKNATILVDAGTTFQLPEMVQDGQTLRTLATVKSGRADFKVDHVGFSNDFNVVTPQTTLAVRGTGFALASGPLKGVDVAGANTNTINAIEVKYIAANMSYFVSGQGKTSSEVGKQDPVQNAWVSTIGPPPIVGTLVSQSDVQQQVAQGIAGANPSSNIQQIQQTQAGEANQNAIDTALVLASDTGGDTGDSGGGYSLFQADAESNNLGISLLNADAQSNRRQSDRDLQSFNQNFAAYESGQWTESLLALNTLWNGSSIIVQDGGYNYGFTSRSGVRALLENIKYQTLQGLAESDNKLNSISFDAGAYFNADNSSAVISELAFQDGAKLNGATNSLLSLSQSALDNRNIAENLNASVQTAFGLVNVSHNNLINAQIALNGLQTGSDLSVGYTNLFRSEFAKMTRFLSNLESLIGTSTSALSQQAYAKLAGVVASASINVAQGLVAAQIARDNFNNASNRGTRALFQAEEQKYLEAVRIRLDSIAYLTKARTNPDGSPAPDGADGIRELTAQIIDNFNQANSQFAYDSFSDYARPHVNEAGIAKDTIVALAGVSTDNSALAMAELEDGSANKAAIDDQLAIMTNAVDTMRNRFGNADAQGQFQDATLMALSSQSDLDFISSNLFKSNFDQLFANGARQNSLDSDLNGLQGLNDLYSGATSVQARADQVFGEIHSAHNSAIAANGEINGLTQTYNSRLSEANSNASASNTTFQEQFANSQATADKYLQDFTTIVGANTTAAATQALQAVTALVGEHNAYVTQAQVAVNTALAAAGTASTRGQQVYMGAVAARMSEAAIIQANAIQARLNVITNGSAIQDNYAQAQADYNSLGNSDNGDDI